MNLRVRSGLAHPCLTLDAISIFNPASTTGFPAVYCRIQFNFASSCQAGTAFPIPLQGYQLLRRVGRIKLWKQVQKTDEFVDITSYGAILKY
jgi:hypothetical protein